MAAQGVPEREKKSPDAHIAYFKAMFVYFQNQKRHFYGKASDLVKIYQREQRRMLTSLRSAQKRDLGEPEADKLIRKSATSSKGSCSPFWD